MSESILSKANKQTKKYKRMSIIKAVDLHLTANATNKSLIIFSETLILNRKKKKMKLILNP